MTTVVNLHWQEYDVYIGRTGRGRDGYHGNPFRAGHACDWCGDVHSQPRDTLPCFRRYLEARARLDPEFLRRTLALDGQRLGCFCAPNPCHGDIIAQFITRRRQRASGASATSVRVDVATSRVARAQRSSGVVRARSPLVAVVNGERYTLHAVTRCAVTLRSTSRLCAFLVRDRGHPIPPECWVPR